MIVWYTRQSTAMRTMLLVLLGTSIALSTDTSTPNQTPTMATEMARLEANMFVVDSLALAILSNTDDMEQLNILDKPVLQMVYPDVYALIEGVYDKQTSPNPLSLYILGAKFEAAMSQSESMPTQLDLFVYLFHDDALTGSTELKDAMVQLLSKTVEQETIPDDPPVEDEWY